MPKVRGFEAGWTYGRRTREHQHYLEVYEQPLWNWLIAHIYHLYDMWIFKVPGFKKLERLYSKYYHWRYAEKDPDRWGFIPIAVRQDLRCYELMRKNKKILAFFKPLTLEQAVKLTSCEKCRTNADVAQSG